MDTRNSQQQPEYLVSSEAPPPDYAIRATRHASNGALNGLASGVLDIRNRAAPMQDRATAQPTAHAAHRAEMVREDSQRLRDKALRAYACTVNYVVDHPVKALLIAASAGAALMTLIKLANRSPVIR